MADISVRGARTHNLKNIDVDIPRDRLTVITGMSGSGKSSLAFDTLFAEGQRRYVESLSSYARQFLSMMGKPDADRIDGLSPAISIEQKAASHNPRSTVGTVTEIYDYLRLLFARTGDPRCPLHQTSLRAQTLAEMVDKIMQLPEGSRHMLLSPVIRGRKGSHEQLLQRLQASGFLRIRLNGQVLMLDESVQLEPRKAHDMDVVVDRFRIREDLAQRLAESLETAVSLSEGLAMVVPMDADDDEGMQFSTRHACNQCGYSIGQLEPRLFSFNNPAGACSACDGLGQELYFPVDRVVTSPEVSLANGAVPGWDKRNRHAWSQLEDLATRYDFSLLDPFVALPVAVQELILHGSRSSALQPASSGRGRKRVWEGVIPQLSRRYRETESGRVREDLATMQDTRVCLQCEGSRLNEAARHVFLDTVSLPMTTAMPIDQALQFFNELRLSGQRAEVAEPILNEVRQRLGFLHNVGLQYLSLDRSAETLSGGEMQRIRLASQIGAGLVGVMYILDEPSIGLHQRDNERLLQTLIRLRDLGNTVIVVEHDEDAIRRADYIIDMGPRAGSEGGQVIASGKLQQILDHPDSLTGKYLRGERCIAVPQQRRPIDAEQCLHIRNARGNNLQGLDVRIPLGVISCVTGVSGSGKSTLINDTLYAQAARQINRSHVTVAACDGIDGLDQVDKVIAIDQSPIGRTPRSNPATYTGLFTAVRDLFAGVPEARTRGYTPGRFSFNVKGGRCESCQGDGLIRVEMHFLPDVYVECEICKGQRYNRETLDIRYRDKNIHEVLSMTIADALNFFSEVPMIQRRLQTLMDVGLGYLQLGQNATTLSGGEAQRIKLSRELSKRDTGHTLYILDEPTTGLHFEDINHLLPVLTKLRDKGNTLVVIEHNLDVIKTADWVIDLGPEGGSLGGRLVAEGTPEAVAENQASLTGRFLSPMLRC